MTAGNLAWWHAMVGAGQFEDGSLVIQDDTLDVNGGSTVNLLVKLGAKPRSDVTVALSETSTLISLGSASLTFTPDNWDTFQSVVVTASGNRQSLDLLSAWFSVGTDGLNRRVAQWNAPTPRPQFIAGLTPGSNRYLVSAGVNAGGTFNLNVTDTASGVSSGPDDLSSTFETDGSVTLSAETYSATVALNGVDTSEPYAIPTNAVVAMANGLSASSVAGTLILRDYEPADATISLSASGNPEYTGVTDSATVSVN